MMPNVTALLAPRHLRNESAKPEQLFVDTPLFLFGNLVLTWKQKKTKNGKGKQI
jgi:hypothetical protein